MPWVKAWVKEGAVRCKDCEREVRLARRALLEREEMIRREADRAREERMEKYRNVDDRRLFIYYARHIAYPKLTYRTIAGYLDISVERTRQLEKDCVKRMRRCYAYFMMHGKEQGD
jgi:DNA-directed RNA polymerase sigma subunit (sigma70/sigma32)